MIGEVTAVTANLSYTVSHVERIRKPELAGGALLDVGVYPINFASMVLGDKVKDVKATAIFQNGVDILDSIAMVFEGDCMATLQCGAREISDRMGSIFGTRGYMQVQNIPKHFLESLYLHNLQDCLPHLRIRLFDPSPCLHPCYPV